MAGSDKNAVGSVASRDGVEVSGALTQEPQSLSDDRLCVRPGADDDPDSSSWINDLRTALRSAGDLCRYVGVDLPVGDESLAGFPVLVPRPFADRIRRGDPTDPLLRQVLPSPDERNVGPAPLDAVGDLKAQRLPGVIQKYQGRVLVMLAGGCAVNCRYCFRRHFPYQDLPATNALLHRVAEMVRNDPSIGEVILSGGDPLMRSDRLLEPWFALRERLPSLKRLRIHTRLPIVIPRRATSALCWLIRSSPTPVFIVLHVNHPKEIDETVARGVGALRDSGAVLMNQSVLLRGVNDNVATLVELSEALMQLGVVPYYLHQLDQVRGVEHFMVDVSLGRQLVTQMREQLPGYAVPRYVQEIPGMPSKTILT